MLVPNRLAFDVEYYAHKLFEGIKPFEKELYPEISGCKPMVYYWGKVATCTNPSCGAKIPLLRQFYLSKRRGAPKKDWVYLNPIINGKDISFEVKKGECREEGWIGRANLKCPCCGNMTEAKVLKKEFISKIDSRRLLAVI